MSDQNLSIQTVTRLLERVGSIERQSRELARLRRENYNVFSLLRKEHDEVYLHSAFLADLLNPCGSHEMDDKFAKLFFEVCELDFPVSAETIVAAERIIPQGRADIYLRSGDHQVIIENKIYAADQHRQLIRYHEYLSARGTEDYLLVYLTLHGKESNEARTEAKKEEVKIPYKRISYGTHILTWLQRCREVAIDHPPLRETIRQYSNLVKKLTGQLTNDDMNDALKFTIQNNYVAATLVSNQLEIVRTKAVAGFFRELVQQLRSDLPNGWSVNRGEKSFEDIAVRSWTSLVVHFGEWDDKVSLELQGTPDSASGPTRYGIVANKHQVNRNLIEAALAGVTFFDQNRKSTIWWVCQDELFNFGDPVEVVRLFDSNQREQLLRITVSKVVHLATEITIPLSYVSQNPFLGQVD